MLSQTAESSAGNDLTRRSLKAGGKGGQKLSPPLGSGVMITSLGVRQRKNTEQSKTVVSTQTDLQFGRGRNNATVLVFSIPLLEIREIRTDGTLF